MRGRTLIRVLVAAFLAAAPIVSVTRTLHAGDREDSVGRSGDAPRAVTAQTSETYVPRGEVRAPWGLAPALVPLLAPASAPIAYTSGAADLLTLRLARPSRARAPPVSDC